ncbi:phage resistance protein [Dankookia rubra]|uniref:Phage resistance protein n=1 Tax=Dankookia rubra TaxID=1442381 RepID=A0A4R5QDV4_9PROT|nr:phage resistance protein [Dankookia rubra]TDH61146.1 phage resistance protein [Dankookia rubra]
MIGARDVESAILGGYAEHVRRTHPNAPTPGFYLGERLFDDARGLRTRLGDTAFFAQLNTNTTEDGDGWGELSAAWDAAAFEAAVLEPPEGEERQRLVGDLISTFFSSYADVAASRGEAFVDLDAGLAIMSRHAQALGYDAVVLFLDELILWLATRAADVNFVSSEGAKLSKLVEAQNANRPIPIISFVARQRDLRELVGEHQAGALQLQFADTLKYWEARFDKVTLEDRNLPVIAERRLLRPTSETAKQELDAAFQEFAGRRRDVLETLLGSDGERALFRMTYPFSPALVQALVAASSVLQRERTALKLMLTLLVKRREELRLGSLIPVGDLWDEIATGDQPFSDGMRIQFDNAKKLWTQKLLPLLEQVHGITWQELREERADLQLARHFENDARLLKTLLLAALVPEVPALRALTAPRLAALNHGSVISPVAGREGGLVLQKLRGWAARVGEIRISDDQVPTVSLQITGVDIEPILANAAQYDNDGTRRSRLQKILFEALGLPADSSLLGTQPFVQYEHPWRGTSRPVDLYFEAVKEIPYDRLRGRPGAPVLVLGMPFDSKGWSPVDHLAHAMNFNDDAASGGVVWQPSYLSDRAMRDLGTLVRIDFLLAGTGDRLAEAARMLSASDREQARAVLKSQQSALHQRLRSCLEAGYGIRPDTDGCIGTSVPAEDRLVSLDTFRPQMPVGATMKDAVSALLDRLFEYRFPAHPAFEQEVRSATLRRVLERVQAAAQQPEQRLHIEERADRQHLAALAGPLKLGTMGQTHFVLSNHWAEHFARMHAQAGGGGPLTVARLRSWMDQPRPMGLTPDVQNLVVLAFAAQADRTLLRNGAPTQASIERIDEAVELREQPLPDETTWARARTRAGTLFGLAPGEVRKGATVARLAAELAGKAAEQRPVLIGLAQELNSRTEAFGVPTAAARLVTLRSAQTLLADLAGGGDALATVTALADATLATSEAAVGRCLGSAADLRNALVTAPWDIIGTAAGLSDQRRAAAEGLRLRVADALEADEHAIALKPVLRDAQTRASRLLAETVQHPPTPQPPLPPPEPPPPPPPPGEEVVEERQTLALEGSDATALLETLRVRVAATPGARLTLGWRLTRRKGGGDA